MPLLWHRRLERRCRVSDVGKGTLLSPIRIMPQELYTALSGQREYHFGVLKKPTDPRNDVTTSGYQESGINEGVVFGGSLRRIVVWVGVLV
jgi:hypothetical protein